MGKKKIASAATPIPVGEKLEALISDFFGGDETIPELDPLFGEPWPEWFHNVALRFARQFAPQMSIEDFKHHRMRFLGVVVAYLQGVITIAERESPNATPKGEFSRALLELAKELSAIGPAFQQEALSMAQRLESGKRAEFFAAYGDGLVREVGEQSMMRLSDTSTVKMCVFLMLARPLIDGRKFGSSREAFGVFCRIHAAFGRPAAANPDALASLQTQFATLCSECGVKFGGKVKQARQ